MSDNLDRTLGTMTDDERRLYEMVLTGPPNMAAPTPAIEVGRAAQIIAAALRQRSAADPA